MREMRRREKKIINSIDPMRIFYVRLGKRVRLKFVLYAGAGKKNE